MGLWIIVDDWTVEGGCLVTTKIAENKEKINEQETIHPVMEEIKQDAGNKPEKYIKTYKIPAEGE